MTVSRPALRYHGGKWVLAKWIISYFPWHKIYTETYGGAASVLLQKSRSYAEIYNELDGEIVNLFRVIRDNPGELIRAIELTPFARDEFVLSYEPSTDAIEQARRTVARSYMGFGSNSHTNSTGFRASSHRSGTTPAKDWRNLPRGIVQIIERMAGVTIENRPAVEVMQAHDSPQTLHCLDPPYPKSTRDSGDDYRFEMSDDDHRAMARSVRELKGSVIISGYPCPLYDEELFPDFHRVQRKALADGARERTEVLWMRNIRGGLFGVTT